MKESGRKTWTATRFKHLYRHRSGVYYGRLRLAGKPTWRSLETKVQTIAQYRLADLMAQEETRAELEERDQPVWTTVGDAMDGWITQVQNDPSTKASTKGYWKEIFTALERSWPELRDLEVAKVSPAQCDSWAGRYSRQVSPTRFNNTLSALKKSFAMAVDRGLRRTNPAAHLRRVKPREKDLTTKLPDPDLFKRWVAEIRRSPSRWGEDCGDLVEFLAYTGLRIGEARCVLWKHCDRQELLVTGDPDQGTKNRQVRRVPIISALADLLERMQARLGTRDPEDKLLRVSVAKEAMDRAAAKVGMDRITHHDLRHLFATTCIESGVDIPTVSKWLGHKDGGALAMRVYGHLRNEHSLASAKLVKWG